MPAVNGLLVGAPAFRDIGGLRTADHRRVRAGRVFRSCGLMELTDADVQVVRDRIGLRCVIDLRDANEVERDGIGPLPVDRLVYRNLPLLDVVEHGPAQGDTLLDRYRRFLERGAPNLARVVETIAEPAHHPLVVHCTAGKDRTGIVTALLLAVLGVDAQSIATDYGAGRAQRDWLLQFLARRGVQGPRLAAMRPEWLDSDPAVMHDFLRMLQAEHGGAARYLAAAGCNGAVLQRLQHALLEPLGATDGDWSET